MLSADLSNSVSDKDYQWSILRQVAIRQAATRVYKELDLSFVQMLCGSSCDAEGYSAILHAPGRESLLNGETTVDVELVELDRNQSAHISL